MPGIWRNRAARRTAEYERRKTATQKATAIKMAAEEALRLKMEHPHETPPERLTKQDKLLIAETYRKKRKLLSLAR